MGTREDEQRRAWEDGLIRRYPRLVRGQFEKTSDPDDYYNCIAWAAENVVRKWWWPFPDNDPNVYWPPGAPRAEGVEAFVSAFRTLGYRPCKNGELEARYQKVAIFVDKNKVPTHMAIQLGDGTWSSKLGDNWDISHAEVWAVENPVYGTVERFLRRKRK